ncbi:MarR family winged helix-turn-helix transcriptional regulator [Polycladidibacter stylochi]|uniref:MarR family winged helix-turn-helix transcriptional regulator n=1 Tax=Polycladidibacter stylochi TaxID=1807766 RepID=UPI0008320E38|nr:MarR family winged helix-turn-helix transcriptional regulator [Pseudovibrio stylochi]
MHFDLVDFFPYQVRLFASRVGDVVAHVYTKEYGLSVSEWRALSILGSADGLSANEVVARSSMDKVNVSRAVQSLRKRNLVKRDIDGADRRKSVLRLTQEGRDIYNKIVPLVIDADKQLTATLSSDEKHQLTVLMQKVQQQAKQILKDQNPT